MRHKKKWADFDMNEWQECLKTALLQAVKELREEYDEVYAISLMASSDLWKFGISANTESYVLEQAGGRASEDYFYYKYAEEEWGISEAAEEEFEEVSDMVRDYLEENGEQFIDEEGDCLNEHYEDFRNELFGTCLRTLIAVSQENLEAGENQPELLWNFYVREFFEAEDMAEIYKMLNRNPERIEEFCSVLDLSC